jgi:MFS family permease
MKEKKYLFGEKHYWMIAIEATLDYCVAVLSSGAYFAKLTTSIGISDSSTAILGALGNFIALLSVFSIYIARRRRIKPIVASMHFTYQLLIVLLFLLPSISVNATAADAVFVAVLIGAKILSPLYANVKSSWYASNIPDSIRGPFGGVYQAISAISAMFVTFGAGSIMDAFESRGNLYGAFFVIGIVILVIAVLDLATILLTRETLSEHSDGNTTKISLFSEVGTILKIPACRNIVLYRVLWAVAAVFFGGFQGTYLIVDLGVSMTTISLISVYQYVAHFVMLLCSGRLAKRFSLSKMMAMGIFIDAISIIPLCLLSDRATIPVYIARITLTLLGGSILSIGNMIVYRILPSELYTAFNVTSSIPTCLASFFTTLALTPLFNYLKYTLGGELFGIKLYAQQTLALLGVLVAIPIWIYVRRVMLPSVRAADKPLHEQKHVAAREPSEVAK